MDILERIIEAVAQKLISMKLEENQYSYSETPDTGDENAGSKRRKEKPKTPKSGIEGTPLTSHQAGASAPSIRTGSNERLVSKVDPQRARTTPIRPQGQSAGGRGGKEETRSERATPPDKPKGRILSREEVVKRLSNN